VRAASRTPAGADGVRFDWAEPDTWRPAVSGCRAVFVMAPDGVPVDPSFLTCAAGEGVERLVLLSSRGVEEMGDERLLAAERAVRAADAEWTVLRPDWFAQNFDEGFLRPAVLAGRVTLPLGDMGQVFVDAGDIAAVAAGALTGEGHAGRTYEVTGPRVLDFAEAVRTVAEAAGRTVHYDGTPEGFLAEQEAAGAPPEAAAAAAAAFAALRATGGGTPTDTVLRVTGRAPLDFSDYAARAAAEGAWRD
jgi:uncharacterized protein YbjT (DUF2867 family)